MNKTVNMLLLSGAYTDIEIVVGNKTYHSHRTILEKSSAALKALFSFNDQQQGSESKSPKLTLSEGLVEEGYEGVFDLLYQEWYGVFDKESPLTVDSFREGLMLYQLCRKLDCSYPHVAFDRETYLSGDHKQVYVEKLDSGSCKAVFDICIDTFSSVMTFMVDQTPRDQHGNLLYKNRLLEATDVFINGLVQPVLHEDLIDSLVWELECYDDEEYDSWCRYYTRNLCVNGAWIHVFNRHHRLRSEDETKSERKRVFGLCKQSIDEIIMIAFKIKYPYRTEPQ